MLKTRIRPIALVALVVASSSSPAPGQAPPPAANDPAPTAKQLLEEALKKLSQTAAAAKEPDRIPLSSYRFATAGDPAQAPYERVVDAGTLRISFSNLVPTQSYDIFWHTTQLVAPPLANPLAATDEALARPSCTGLALATREVWASQDEPQVAARVSALRAAIAASDCDVPAVKAAAAAAIEATLWSGVIEAKIEPGTVLEVTVRRQDGRVAVFLFTGPPPPRFFQTYGFSYLRRGDQEFFTESNGADKFVIRATERRYEWRPAGLLLLNYRLGGPWTGVELALNVAGALSFDGDQPAVGLGVNVTLANNLGLVLGVAMSEETRLRGQYRPGPGGTLLSEELAADQLVEKGFDETLFVGLSLNLSSNPFKKKAETKAEPAKDGAK